MRLFYQSFGVSRGSRWCLWPGAEADRRLSSGSGNRDLRQRAQPASRHCRAVSLPRSHVTGRAKAGSSRAGAPNPAAEWRNYPRIPSKPADGTFADPEWQDRDHLGDGRELWSRRLPQPPRVAAAQRRPAVAACGAFSASADRQSTRRPAAQPARLRRRQPGIEDQGTRAGAHPPTGRRRARDPGR